MPTIGEFFAYGLAALSLILNFSKGQRDNKADSEARGRWQGGVDKTLEQLLTTSQDTAKKVNELASVPSKMDAMDTRIGNLENKFDRHCQEERGDLK